MIVQRVFTRHLAGLDMLDPHQRPDTGPCVVDLVEACIWKREPRLIDQVCDIFFGSRDFGRVAAIVGIRCPDQRVAQPGDDEEQPAIAPGEEHVGIATGRRRHQMHAFGQS